MTTSTHRGLKAVVTTTLAAAGLAVLPATVGSAAVASAAADVPVTPDFLEQELLDVHEFWARVETAANGPATDITYMFPVTGQVVPTPCQASDDDAMFYCSANDEIVFSQDIAQRLWQGSFQSNHGVHTGPADDLAVATMIAHEYAHDVQQEVGILGSGRPSINIELHADCWAGVWLNDSYQAGQLQGTDVEEALAVMERVGDDEAPYTHGTSEQRHYALQSGYDAGVPAACAAILDGTWLA